MSLITGKDANPLIPEETAKAVINGITEKSAALSMFRRLPNMGSKTLRMPVLNALADAAFTSGNTVDDDLSAGADVQVDDTQKAVLDAADEIHTDAAPGLKDTMTLDWENVFIVAETMAIVVPVPDEVLADAEYDIWGESMPSIIQAFGKKLDSAIIWGQGRPVTWPTGIVPTCLSRGFHVTEGDKANLAGDVSALMGKLEAIGYDANGFMMAPSVKQSLRDLTSNTGAPIFQPSLVAGTPDTLYAQPTSYIKNNSFLPNTGRIIAGDMEQAVFSMRQDMTFKIFDQAVITNNEGVVTHNLMQQDSVAMRIVLRMGWAVPNPIHALAIRAERYPFAFMKAAA